VSRSHLRRRRPASSSSSVAETGAASSQPSGSSSSSIRSGKAPNVEKRLDAEGVRRVHQIPARPRAAAVIVLQAASPRGRAPDVPSLMP